MKIRHKLLIGFLFVAFLVWPAGYFSMRASEEALTNSIGQSAALLARQSLDHLEHENGHL